MNFESLFLVRYRIARIGESDWLNWWSSNALSDEGQYVVARLFRRTVRATAAHLAIAAARTRHDAQAPHAPVVHLFNFGDEIEGEFERWIVARKADGWLPPELPAPSPENSRSALSALNAADVLLGDDKATLDLPLGPPFVIGIVTRSGLRGNGRLLRAANQLARAYASVPVGAFTPPLFHLDG